MSHERRPLRTRPDIDAALAELESVDRAATSAPWTNSEGRRFRSEEGVDEGWQTADQERDEAAACLSRNALPRLIATIRALTAGEMEAVRLLRKHRYAIEMEDQYGHASEPRCPECGASEGTPCKPDCAVDPFLKGKP